MYGEICNNFKAVKLNKCSEAVGRSNNTLMSSLNNVSRNITFIKMTKARNRCGASAVEQPLASNRLSKEGNEKVPF